MSVVSSIIYKLLCRLFIAGWAALNHTVSVTIMMKTVEQTLSVKQFIIYKVF